MVSGRSPSTPGTGGRAAIIGAAEELIALRGASVPLRDISRAAGQRNNSAVQYHFDSREELVVAVIEHRAPTLEARRLERLVAAEAAGAADDPRTLVDALVTPLLEAAAVDGWRFYARFLQQVSILPDALGRPTLDVHRASVRLINARLEGAMRSLPAAERQLRIEIFNCTLLALAADHERRVAARPEAKARLAAQEAIVDALTAILVHTSITEKGRT